MLNENVCDESLDRLKEDQFKYRSSDVLIAGYPKSGNHWLVNIVCLLYGADDIDKVLETNMWQQYLVMECHFRPNPTEQTKIYQYDKANIEVAEDLADPRVFITHMPARFYEKELKRENARFIVPVRNVKDVLVSWYKHQLIHPAYANGMDLSFEDFFQFFLEKKLGFGDWFENVTSWEAFKDSPTVLFVNYEENIKHHSRVVRDIARFLQLDVDDEKLDRVAEETLFKNTKSNKNRGQAPWIDNTRGSFMRKGQVGSWKEDMTEVQSELVDELIRDKLKNSKLKFEYE